MEDVVKSHSPPQQLLSQSGIPRRDVIDWMLSVEDRFHLPGKFKKLLERFHFKEQLPLDIIAVSLDIPSELLSQIMKTIGFDLDDENFQQHGIDQYLGLGKGLIIRRILHAWQQTNHWPSAAKLLRLSLFDLWMLVNTSGVHSGFINMISSEDLQQLADQKDKPLEQFEELNGFSLNAIDISDLRENTKTSSKKTSKDSSRYTDVEQAFFRSIRGSKQKIPTREEEIQLFKELRACEPKSKEAKRVESKIVSAHILFVVSIAKQYLSSGLPLLDLIQEGAIGLLKAIRRFDHTIKFRLITYAVWWIRQGILKGISEQSRLVRLPLNRSALLYKTKKASDSLIQELGHVPTPEEIADHLGVSEDDVKEAETLASSHASLDKEFGDGNETTLMDVIEDTSSLSPHKQFAQQSLSEEIENVIDTLSPQHAYVISLYFGLNGYRAHTLEQIGAELGLTRERARQIKEVAIRRLKHSSRSTTLRAYLSGVHD